MLEGVRNTLNKPICRVYGGTHLIEADPDRIRTTVEELKRMGLHVLGLGHCSGELAENIICEDKEVSSCHMGVGDTIFIH
jgi:7,8-dihydropterin-6-yl-methyl-4-(beta-D-ribofuranosyl)aminobenzene 5'-phosphate synthase